eukprot:scpid79180/ scgid10072/ 
MAARFSSAPLRHAVLIVMVLVVFLTRIISALPTQLRSTAMDDSGKQFSAHSPDVALLVESTATIFNMCRHTNMYRRECEWHKSKISKILKRIFKVYDVSTNETTRLRIREDALSTTVNAMVSENKIALLERASLQVMSFCVLNLSYCKTDMDYVLLNFDPAIRRG